MLTKIEADTIARLLNGILDDYVVRSEGKRVLVWRASNNALEPERSFVTMAAITEWLRPLLGGMTDA